MILIFIENINPRINYVFTHLFNNILGIEYKFTSNLTQFSESTLLKISYSKLPVNNEIHIQKNGDITQLQHPQDWKNYDEIIQCFLLLTRYEEYLPHKKDIHGRFPYSQSTQFTYVNIEKPFVDIVAANLKNRILEKNPHYIVKENEYKVQMTVDIDRVYECLGLSFKESIFYVSKKLLKLKFSSIINFIKVNYYYWIEALQPKIRDSYDAYNYILKHFPNTIFFIQVGKKGKYDKNYSIKNKLFKRKIETLSWTNSIGIHPSYQSKENIETIKTEILNLETLIRRKVIHSRQHYLKMSLPTTYNNLIKLGIKNEYSMGFFDRIGFKAGTSFPFFWYNIKEEKETKLQIFPFQVMDVTLKNYMKLSPNLAIEEVNKIKNEIKIVKGTFSLIFHNQNLTNIKEWKNWNSLFESIS